MALTEPRTEPKSYRWQTRWLALGAAAQLVILVVERWPRP